MNAIRASRFALLLVAALPLAAAQPYRAELWFDAAPALDGEGTATGAGEVFALLSLAEAIRAGEGLRISWSSANGTETVRSAAQEQLDVGPSPQYQRQALSSATNDFRWDAGSLEGFACGSDCKAFLVTAPGGSVGVRGRAHGAVEAADGPTVIAVGNDARIPAPSRRIVESADAGAFAGSERVPLATGNVTLYLWDVQAVLHAPSGTEAVTTGVENDSAHVGMAGVGAGSVKLRTITMSLHGARLDAPRGSRVALLASRIDVALEGSLASAKADGWAEAGGRRAEVRAQSVEATGAVRTTLAPAPRGEGPASDPVDRVGERQHGDLAGDGELRVAGERIAPNARPPAIAPAEVAVGSAAVLVALALALRGGALLALYTRVTRARVLENGTRSALYARVRERPGAHVAELARELGVGRVALQHHLRMLEMHRLVVPRRSGRLLAYFPPSLVPDASALSASVALKDRTRRSVLDAIRLQGAATQADVAASTGLPLRLVSYHVARLEAAGLLRGDGARPQRYAAAPA